jgi:hypothetical protein
MSGIFVNYRSGDHTTVVEALHRELARHFGEGQVFFDTSSLRPGDRYPDGLRSGVRGCEVLLVVIHADWLGVDESGTRLVDREGDWVRREIEMALDGGKPVVPVLLGEARLPAPQELPPSIRDLALRQAHRIRRGFFGTDVERLVGRLEHSVAPTWLPPAVTARVRRRPGRWLAWVTAVLATALLLGPAVRSIIVSDPSQAVSVAAAARLAGWMISMMAAPLLGYGLALALTYPFRDKLDALDRDVQTTPAARFNRYLLALLLFLIGSVVVVVASAVNDPRLVLLMILMATPVLILFAAQLMRAERREEEDQANWPQQLPSIHGAIVELRFAVAQLRTRVREWKRPLSREQRDKSWWCLAMLSEAVDRVHAQAGQPRLRGQLAEYPWLTSLYTVWAAFALGLVGEATVPMIYWQTAELQDYVTLAVFALVIAVVSMGNIEVLYRYRRRLLLRPAMTIRKDIAELSGRVLLDGVDDVSWASVRDAYGPAVKVPLLLRQVACVDPAAQQAAVDDLCDRLLHRDTVAEATGYAVPFLANLSTGRHLAAQTRSRLAVLLARIAVAHRYYSADNEPVSLSWDVTGSAEPEPNRIRQARTAVEAATPRLLEHLRVEREEDVPSVVALTAAAPAVVTPRLGDELSHIAERDRTTIGAAAGIVQAVLRKETVSPAQLSAAADGDPAVLDHLQRSLGRCPLLMVARKTAIELVALGQPSRAASGPTSQVTAD